MFLIALHCTVNKVKLGSEKMQRATSHTILLESIMHDFALIANVCTVFRTILLHYSFAYTANVYRQRTDKLLFLYAIITHENV